MTSQLSEDVILEISSQPQLLTAETVGSGGGGRAGTYSGSVELGRRLLVAARGGDTAAVLELMGAGAPFTTDWLGTSPLHLAASGAHAHTCAVLLRGGVSRDARTKVERTPLHLAAANGHADVCNLLIDNGANVDCRDMLRMTPLHWAVQRGHTAVVKALLLGGADPLALSKFEKTPRSLAAAARRADLLALIDSALKEREENRQAGVLAHSQRDDQSKEITAAEQQRALESIERLQETVKPAQKQQTVHTEPIKIEFERSSTEHPESSEQESESAAALLKKHGITLLPHDETSTVLNAIQSGRTVVLSDAGKLMLKESSTVGPQRAATGPGASGPPPAPVILRAAPVKEPPAPGVKVFTLNNTLLANHSALAPPKPPLRKVINPHDMQIKFLSVGDTKLLTPSKGTLKAKNRIRASLQPSAGGGTGLSAIGATYRPAANSRPVKIILNKANFNKMLAGKAVLENGHDVRTNNTMVGTTTDLAKLVRGGNATVPAAGPAPAGGGAVPAVGSAGGGGGGGGYLCVPQEYLSSTSAQYLRGELLAAHHTIHDLNKQLAALKQRLALYETI